MRPALVPELGVTDWRASRAFYVDVLGFDCRYERPEEGFCFLCLGTAELMIDQMGAGRDFVLVPPDAPFGRGMNLQIEVPAIAPFLAALKAAGHPLFLPPEDRWYRRNDIELGNRQFLVADPDGYLLRFFQSLGERPAADR
ncbi:bleomycin resistance protein [Acidimangrovimonas sediminis]|uniref:bleomycin resistance protein n=1 Tax=Acidimangrovimonas sediminis TaxID=2056283 RepID=UPI000C8084BB|nr:VOC family protein [Acidimangrovimonas sediminis]